LLQGLDVICRKQVGSRGVGIWLMELPEYDVSAALNLTTENRQSPTVLLVEDEVLVRMMLADQLREAGCTVVEASDADEALLLLRQNLVRIDLVISDVRMPGSMDGLGLARVIRSECPELKIILMSGHHRALEGPDYDAFFPKPYDGPAIIRKVRSYFE
jgi:two-component system, response regulator PdtaR